MNQPLQYTTRAQRTILYLFTLAALATMFFAPPTQASVLDNYGLTYATADYLGYTGISNSEQNF